MSLPYFNKIVNYEILKIGKLELSINNVTLEAIPLLNIFITTSKHMNPSILKHFTAYFDDVNENSLYIYLEKVIKILHNTGSYPDDTLLYLLHLLHIPRKYLANLSYFLSDPYHADRLNPDYSVPLDQSINKLWRYLKGEIINIEESIPVYNILIDRVYWEVDDINRKILEDVLDEAAMIYLDNGQYRLYFIHYTNVLATRFLLHKYIGITSDYNNIHLPKFTLHNYTVVCGKRFTVHDPLLEVLPDGMKQELINSNIYYSHLGMERSTDMKDFLEIVYDNANSMYTTPSGVTLPHGLILLLIDLKLIYRYVNTLDVKSIYSYEKVYVEDFITETDVSKLKQRFNKSSLAIREDEPYTNELWNIIKLFREYNLNDDAIRLYKNMIVFVNITAD